MDPIGYHLIGNQNDIKEKMDSIANEIKKNWYKCDSQTLFFLDKTYQSLLLPNNASLIHSETALFLNETLYFNKILPMSNLRLLLRFS